MTIFKTFFIATAVCLVSTGWSHNLFGNDHLAKVVEVLPAGINTLTIVDYTALDDSRWAQDNRVEIGDLLEVPRDARKVVFASDLNFDYVYPNRQFAFATFSKPIDLSRTVRLGQSEIESVAGHEMTWLDGRVAAASVSDNTIAIFPTQGRQSATRWIRTHLDQPNAERASVFLRYAANEAEKQQNLLVVALDLRDAVSPANIRRNVLRSPLFEETIREVVISLLSSIEGAVLTVRSADSLDARLQVRFEESVEILKGREVQLVDSVLRSIGAKVNGIEQWEANVEKNVLTLYGPLQKESLEDILQLTVFDTQMPANLRQLTNRFEKTGGDSDGYETPDYPSETLSEAEQTSLATEEFLERMERLLQSLHRKTEAEGLAESRFWLDRYAFKLQYLKRNNVDEALLRFADITTARLQAMAETLENGLLEAAQEHESGWVATPTWRTVNYGGVRFRRRAFFYGGTGWGNEPAGVDEMQVADEINDAVVKVKSEGIAIVRDFNEVGQQLAAKHGFNFKRWTPGEIR